MRTSTPRNAATVSSSSAFASASFETSATTAIACRPAGRSLVDDRLRSGLGHVCDDDLRTLALEHRARRRPMPLAPPCDDRDLVLSRIADLLDAGSMMLARDQHPRCLATPLRGGGAAAAPRGDKRPRLTSRGAIRDRGGSPTPGQRFRRAPRRRQGGQQYAVGDLDRRPPVCPVTTPKTAPSRHPRPRRPNRSIGRSGPR